MRRLLLALGTVLALNGTGAGAQALQPPAQRPDAGNAQAQVKPAPTDAAITERVESALAKDPFLRAMDIHVETQDGVVNLTGFVRSLDDVAKAEELARAVSGVAAVRNHLRVANRPSRA